MPPIPPTPQREPQPFQPALPNQKLWRDKRLREMKEAPSKTNVPMAPVRPGRMRIVIRRASPPT